VISVVRCNARQWCVPLKLPLIRRESEVVILQDDSMSLSYSAVRAILTSSGDPLSQQDVAEFFRIVDEDQDGMLHIQELMKVQHSCWLTITRCLVSLAWLSGSNCRH
jgi:hypothetical protein